MTTREQARELMNSYRMANAKVLSSIIEADTIKSGIFRITQIFTDDESQRTENDNSREKMVMGYLCIKERIAEEQEEAAKKRDMLNEIVGIIEKTNEKHATMLKCKYFSSMSVAQIAEKTGYSETSVKRILAAALDDVALVLSVREESK